MFNRCTHQWKEIHRDVQERKLTLKVGAGAQPPQLNDLVYGCTHIELRCTACGDVQGRKISGEHPTTGRS